MIEDILYKKPVKDMTQTEFNEYALYHFANDVNELGIEDSAKLLILLMKQYAKRNQK